MPSATAGGNGDNAGSVAVGWERGIEGVSKTCQEAFGRKTSKRIYSVSEIAGNSPQNRAYRMHTITAHTLHGMAISDDERAFFIALGGRIAAQRKAQGITQVELAETLGVSQQAMNSFEKGRRRVPVSLLPVIAQTLQTTLDALVVHDLTPAIAAPKKRGPQKKIRQQLEQIEALPPAKQRVITQLIDSVLAQAAR